MAAAVFIAWRGGRTWVLVGRTAAGATAAILLLGLQQYRHLLFEESIHEFPMALAPGGYLVLAAALLVLASSFVRRTAPRVR
jgi:hypothetical protein